MSVTNFQAGLRLGPYEILNLLGAGGMGEVYRARDTRLRRDVAVKMLPPAVAGDAELLKRLQREARAVGQLNHPNIVAIYDIGSQDGYEYVVMELLEGETLATKLRSGALPVRKTLDFAIQIARGLAAAHEKHIIHRDLKPENIFITRDGRVKILDFGLARELPAVTHHGATAARLTMPGMVVGTAAYMSPEQARGLPIDQRSDVFSFGVVLYEMISGTNPFDAPSAIEAMSAILSRDAPDLAEAAPGVPAILRRVVHHCLEKKKEDRFQSVNDLLFDLESCSEITLGVATNGMGVRPMFRKARPWLRVASIGALVAVLAAVATALVLRSGAAKLSGAPAFRRMTFGYGIVQSARFTPDGRMIVYSAAWKGQPLRLFLLRIERPEAQALPLPIANLSSISPTGEMAVVLSGKVMDWRIGGTLAQVPVLGGTPRELLENVIHAEWAPDGRLAVVRRTDKGSHLEFPIGKVLYTTQHLPVSLRISPKGDQIALHLMGGDFVPNELLLIGTDGKKRTVMKGMHSSPGMAWSADGEELWFSASPHGESAEPPSIYAVDMKGRQRLVTRMPGWLWLHDLSRDGLALVSYNTWQSGIILRAAGEQQERDLSWLDWSVLADISSDGKTILFTEAREGAGNKAVVYLRGIDDPTALRLGDGQAMALSPDAQWVLALRDVSSKRRLVILPTKAGQPQTPTDLDCLWAGWLPDGRIVLSARTPEGPRMFLLARDGSAPQPLTPPGMSIGFISNDGGGATKPISPDGRWVVAVDTKGKVWLHPVGPGQPRPLGGMLRHERVAGWSRDGERLFVYSSREVPIKMHQIRVSTGERTFVRDLTIADLSGVYRIDPALVMPDGESFVIGYKRTMSTLYVAEGLR